VLLGACSSSSSAEQATTAPTAAPTTAAPTTLATTVAPVETTLDTLLSPAVDSTLPSLDEVDDTLPQPEPPPPPDLSIPRNQIGTMQLPSIEIDMPLFEGVSLPVLDKGPGHWPGSAMPGRVGNVVIAGHRTSHNRPFYNIDKMKVGDEIVFNVDGGRYVYLVRETQIVYPDALWIVEQTPEKTATLFACHPKGSTKQRIVVFADYSPEKSTPAA
jgi:sortase A